jgi:hypothetical protein
MFQQHPQPYQVQHNTQYQNHPHFQHKQSPSSLEREDTAGRKAEGTFCQVELQHQQAEGILLQSLCYSPMLMTAGA